MGVTRIVKWLYRSGTLWILLASTAIWGVYQVVKPTQPHLTSRQRSMVTELTREVSEWAEQLQPRRSRAVFLTLGRDEFGLVSDRIRQVMWQSDRFNLRDYSVREKLCRLIEWTRPTVGSSMEATERARDRGSEYAVWGRVEEFSDVGGEARLAVRLQLVDAVSGETLAGRDFEVVRAGAISRPMPEDDSGESVPGLSFVTRVFIWVIAALALPLMTYPLGKRVLTGDSNAAVLALLASLVLASTGVAYVLFMYMGGGIIGGLVLLVCFGLALVYDWYALSTIKRVVEP
jgi:hypothetical protein